MRSSIIRKLILGLFCTLIIYVDGRHFAHHPDFPSFMILAAAILALGGIILSLVVHNFSRSARGERFEPKKRSPWNDLSDGVDPTHE